MVEQYSTDLFPRLDVFQLHRKGALSNGAISKWKWPSPIAPLTIVARAENRQLFLRINNGEEVAFGIVAELATLGGSYPFLRCGCERSARYLYILRGRIACFSCHGLTHPSRMQRWLSTTERRVNKARARLVAAEIEAYNTNRAKRLKLFPRVPS
jgi:hypothetical protein